jgi:hypothetical protein
MTTYPVAIKHGQGRVHVPDPIPYHVRCEHVKCPEALLEIYVSIVLGTKYNDFDTH